MLPLNYSQGSENELKDFVVKNGCFSHEENKRIYDEWFSTGPRYLFRAVDRKYGISRKQICDVGCAYGTNLLYCAQGSYGIEIDQSRANFAASLGLTVYVRDIVDENVADLPKAKVVWCSAVLEHVRSPYIFLLRLRHLLEPGGILALYVPTIPVLPFLQSFPGIGRYVSGYKARNHFYAFVPSTLRFICEKAGFRTIEVAPFYPRPFRFFDRIPGINRIFGRAVYVGELKVR